MTDREMIQLAAKAAGIDGVWSEMYQAYGDLWVSGIDTSNPSFWNPLIINGDALQLACKICADVFVNQVTVVVEVGHIKITQQISDGDKPLAARRAIVRAAAEIGRGMT